MRRFFKEWKRNREIRRDIARISCMNLGAEEAAWDGFITCGLSRERVDYFHDATKPYPKPFRGHFDFIWSERMLEHIDAAKVDEVFRELSVILKRGGRARFCLPLCFHGTARINMVREGNEANCERMGHITWFTRDGFGPVTPEVFGAKDPPSEIQTKWESVTTPHDLRYESVRHYEKDGTLRVNDAIMPSVEQNPFSDHPEVVLARPDSLIFDLVKT